MKRLTVGMAIAFLAVGCSTIHISSPGTLKGVDVKGADGRADRAISIGNEGYYLFQCWPIVSGSMEWDSRTKEVEDDIALFSSEVNLDKMLGNLYRYADKYDSDVVDIVINNKSECKIGLFGLLDWFNTVVGVNSATVSGVLCPRRK